LTGDDHDDFIELCCSYLNGHNWQTMKGEAEPKKVCEALKAMAALFGEAGKAANDADDIAAAHELFQAANSEDGEAIARWARNHPQWEKLLAAENIGDAAKAVAAHTARFFRTKR
jgi:hypothetical protein